MSWRTDPSRVSVLEAVVKKQPQLSEELTLLPNLNYYFLPIYDIYHWCRHLSYQYCALSEPQMQL